MIGLLETSDFSSIVGHRRHFLRMRMRMSLSQGALSAGDVIGMVHSLVRAQA